MTVMEEKNFHCGADASAATAERAFRVDVLRVKEVDAHGVKHWGSAKVLGGFLYSLSSLNLEPKLKGDAQLLC